MIAIENIYMIGGNTKEIIADIDMGSADFSGVNIKWFLKRMIGQEPILTKDSTSGVTSVGKVINIRLKTSDTKELEPGTYWHELKIFDQFDEETTLLCGDFVIYAG